MTKEKQVLAYIPNADKREFILEVYNDFLDDKKIKDQPYGILNDRTLKDFWSDSNYDYNVLVEDDETNPVTQYSSSISRDKANTFISSLSLQLLYPGVVAQNTEQEIDNIMSKVSRSVLEWQFENDGKPAESGLVKNSRNTHKQVVEGTVHIQDDFTKDGRLISSGVPNEEIYVPNFHQPNIQLQAHLMRLSENKPYKEVEAEFGEYPEFKYVSKGMNGWIQDNDTYKDKYKGIVQDDKVTVVRIWKPVSKKDLKRLKADGRLAEEIQKAKFYNVIINGVVIFDIDNLMPYHDGNYSINKGIFESFGPSEFYWGNSMPNKARQDKKWLDGWKTLIRYKAKLGAFSPLLNYSGQHIDEDVVVPAKITDLPRGIAPEQITEIPGISNGITNGDIAILKDATDDIDRATASPQTSGINRPGGQQTARETMIIEANAQKIMMGFAQQIAFLQEARVYSILKRSYQLIPRSSLEKIAIPNQVFGDGKSGIMEVIFKDMKGRKDTDEAKLNDSFKVYEKEIRMEDDDGIARNIFVLDPEYVYNLEFYVKALADSLPRMTSALKESKATLKYETYKQDLYIDPIANIRNLIRAFGDNEDELIRKGGPLPQPDQKTPTKDANMKSGAERQSKQLNNESL